MSWALNFNPIVFLPHHNGILDYKLTLFVYLFYARPWAKHFTWVNLFSPYSNPHFPDRETKDAPSCLWLYQSNIYCSLVSGLSKGHLIVNKKMQKKKKKKKSVAFSSGKYVQVFAYMGYVCTKSSTLYLELTAARLPLVLLPEMAYSISKTKLFIPIN